MDSKQLKRITLLGSTGSIGASTLSVLAQNKEQFEVVALTAHTRTQLLFEQCQQFHPRYAVVATPEQASVLQANLLASKLSTEVLYGPHALEEVASLPETDYVMAGIVGAAGLLPTLAAAKAGKRILLANKEALVMSGALFMETVNAHGATLLPVDSEHNAIFQCLPTDYRIGETPRGIDKITLTASGGPFRTLPLSEFDRITPEQAIAHPNWQMGQKISVDSATMFNKGLEIIEAHWLFNMPLCSLDVLIHPESIIHSMVSYSDGSTLAQLGLPDMKTPIAYTLSWPKRISSGVSRLNLADIGRLTFEPLSLERFPCLQLAYEALRAGGDAVTVLNAANEVAVAAFLEKRIRFTQIPTLISDVLNKIPVSPIHSYEAVMEADNAARRLAHALICLY